MIWKRWVIDVPYTMR